MRIAIFSEVYWPMVSGVSRSLERLVDAMTARGHECRVYTASYPLPKRAADRPEIHRSPAVPLFLYPDVSWAFPRQADLEADLARFRPDLVHVATEFAMGLTGMRLARRHGIPAVASAHTDYERYASRYNLAWVMPAGWSYLRWFYGGARAVLCPSRDYQAHLDRRGVVDTGIWTRGVDTRVFSPGHRSGALREELGIATDVPIVLYVGRLAAEKNLTLLLDAWDWLVRHGAPGELVLVGTGPLADAIARRRYRRVHLAGLRTGSALSAAYASADCFAFPSSTETFGNVLLEAMASGLPSLAVHAGGVLDFARHADNAWLVAPDSVEAIAQGLRRLLTDATLRTDLAAGALATAHARDWDSVFDAVEACYLSHASGDRLPLAA